MRMGKGFHEVVFLFKVGMAFGVRFEFNCVFFI